MNLRISSYILILFAIFLFIIPLYIGNKAISNSSVVIENIQDELLDMVELTYAIEHNVYKHRNKLLEKIIKEEPIDLEIEGFDLDENIDLLNITMDRADNSALKKLLNRLHKRLIAFGYVEASLVEALESHDKEDFEDALIGYSSVAKKVTSDVEELQDLSGIYLNSAIAEVQEASADAALHVSYSIFGGIALLLFAFYTMQRLNSKYKTQMQRAQEAEEKQRALQKKLANYSMDLEHDVAKKTEELEYRYYHQPLTQLPNRHRLIDDINVMGDVNIALFNLDKFQEFNDYFGEARGNVAIQEMAKFLQKSTPDSCSLYHVNGDEFALLSSKVRIKEEFIEGIRGLQKSFNKEQFQYGDEIYILLASVGIASSSANQLACADIALKEAKKHHSGLSVYNSSMEMEKTYEKNLEFSKKLVQAMEDDNIVPFYQPIVSLKNDLPVRFEGLVRMLELDGTVNAPHQFLDIAKRLRLYPQLTRTMFYKVLQTIQEKVVSVSINLSVDDINNDEIVKMIINALSSFEHNRCITFEILETEAMENYDDIQIFIDSVRSHGAKVAIDDFGSGYSNFAHILNMNVDYIKIDASLISKVDVDKNAQLMVKTIVQLAKQLNIETVAEYVSTKEIYMAVKALGVDWAQGYWLGRPMPLDKMQRDIDV